MRIVSLNAWGGALWLALSVWLPEVVSDVLCLQEVTRSPEPAPDWLVYADPNRRLDQRADLFLDVSAVLPRHQARFAAAARGRLADSDGRGHWSEHGLGTWVAPNLAIVASRQEFAYGAYRRDGRGEEPVPRALQGHRVVDPATGCSALVINLHGIRHPQGKGDLPACRLQAETVCRFVSEMRRPDEPTILAGDFNVLPDNPIFAMLSDLGMTDLVTTRGHTDTRTSLYRKPVRHANYCFVSQEVRVRSFDIPAHPEVSDHRPLVLDLTF